MVWPHLGGKLFACFCIAMLCRVTIAHADGDAAMEAYGMQIATEQDLQRAPQDIDSKIKTDGDCQLTDEDKKNFAQQAKQAMTETVHELVEFNKIMLRNFKDENGVCHYLDNRWLNSDDENRYIISATNFDRAGAAQADNINLDKITTKKLTEYNSKLTYAGIDVRKLMTRAAAGDYEADQLPRQLQSKRTGERIEINEATSELLEEAFGFKVDCHHVVKLDDSGAFLCDQRSGQDTTMDKVMVQIWAEDSISGLRNMVGSSQIAFICTANKCYDDDGKEYDSFVNTIQKHLNKADKCRAAMEEALVQRDKFIAKRKEAHKLLSILSGHLDISCKCETQQEGESTGTDGSPGNDGQEGNTQGGTGKVMDCQAAEDPNFVEDNMVRCKTVTEFQRELADTCPTCDLLATIAAAAQGISKGSFEALAKDLIALLIIGFSIYVAYVTLITIASPEAQKISKYLSTLLIQGFKVTLAILILQNPSYLYKGLLGPVLDGGVDFGMSLLDTTSGTAASNGEKYTEKFDGTNEYLDAKTLQNLVGVADTMNKEVAQMPAVGKALICRSFEPEGITQEILDKFLPFPYQFSMFIEGIIVYIFGMMIMWSLIAYMLDCMIELGIVCAIMPFCVACWPFKLTSNYTKVGWNMFLNVFFNFVMLAVVVITIIRISVQALAGGMPSEDFIKLINGDMVKVLKQQMDIGSMQMLIVFVCAMICLKLAKEVTNLANKFAGGAQVSVGSELAGMAAQVATKAAIGDGLQKGKDGKRHAGGALGLLVKAGGSAAEHSGLKGAARAAKNKLMGKSKNAGGGKKRGSGKSKKSGGGSSGGSGS